jgi:hypothetical protein
MDGNLDSQLVTSPVEEYASRDVCVVICKLAVLEGHVMNVAKIVTEAPAGGSRMNNIIVLLVLSLFLAACGPSDFEKQKLEFERQKYNDEQAAKAEAARKEDQDRQDQKTHWMGCRVAAEDQYSQEFKMWGEPVPGKPGVRSGPTKQSEDMKNRLQRQKEQCDRNFPKGISW